MLAARRSGQDVEYFDILTRAGARAARYACCGNRLIWTHVDRRRTDRAAYFSFHRHHRFVTGRKDIEFSWIFWLFASFIVAAARLTFMSSGPCGTPITAMRP
jgi:hypothetical protein